MRVVNPGPGELYDRLSILALKVQYGKEKNIDVSDWEQEEYEVLCAISAHFTVDSSKIKVSGSKDNLQLVGELNAVNKNVWVAIDQQREYQKVDLHSASEPTLREIARLGLYVMEMNDVRAKLIGEINELYGIKRTEKIPYSSGNFENVGRR